MENKEFKGTTGPWGYCPSSIDRKHNFAVLVEGTGSMVADVYLKRDWDEEATKTTERPDISEANARLIAAAPDLLKSLQELAQYASIESERSVERLKRAETAIMKALGTDDRG